jgi:hypothetical protein
LGVAENRAYSSAKALIENEARRADRVDVIAVMTPNDSHYEICSLAMDAGFHVICDKPLTTDLDSAVSLARKVKETGAEGFQDQAHQRIRPGDEHGSRCRSKSSNPNACRIKPPSSIVRGNTNAAVIAIAERAADLVKAAASGVGAAEENQPIAAAPRHRSDYGNC